MVVAVSAPVDTEPEVAPPVEKPVPVQEVALVEDQVSVEEPPEVMLVGFAEREAVGEFAGVTLTVAVSIAESVLDVPPSHA